MRTEDGLHAFVCRRAQQFYNKKKLVFAWTFRLRHNYVCTYDSSQSLGRCRHDAYTRNNATISFNHFVNDFLSSAFYPSFSEIAWLTLAHSHTPTLAKHMQLNNNEKEKNMMNNENAAFTMKMHAKLKWKVKWNCLSVLLPYTSFVVWCCPFCRILPISIAVYNALMYCWCF